MSPENVVLIGVAVVAVAAALAIFTIAYRRSTDWRDRVNAETVAADRSELQVTTEAADLEEASPDQPDRVEESSAEATDDARQPDTAAAVTGLEISHEPVVVEASAEETGFTRRQFFNRALSATFFSFLAGFGLYSLAFLWPRITGGFGSDVNVGNVNDLREQLINEDGSVTPLFIPEARTFLVPYDEASPSPQFENLGVADRGVMALFQRCVHLGCRVPYCQTSQGFECPCHGSKYSLLGEYFAGPATRNLDRFLVEINSADDLIIKTGTIIQTPRAPTLSVAYPQGASCISATSET